MLTWSMLTALIAVSWASASEAAQPEARIVRPWTNSRRVSAPVSKRFTKFEMIACMDPPGERAASTLHYSLLPGDGLGNELAVGEIDLQLLAFAAADDLHLVRAHGENQAERSLLRLLPAVDQDSQARGVGDEVQRAASGNHIHDQSSVIGNGDDFLRIAKAWMAQDERVASSGKGEVAGGGAFIA